jgi:hypothetical protein
LVLLDTEELKVRPGAAGTVAGGTGTGIGWVCAIAACISSREVLENDDWPWAVLPRLFFAPHLKSEVNDKRPLFDFRGESSSSSFPGGGETVDLD